jgi:hypothetical protein
MKVGILPDHIVRTVIHTTQRKTVSPFYTGLIGLDIILTLQLNVISDGQASRLVTMGFCQVAG